MKVKGPIFMYFETGMEGCDWAIQDESSISKDGYYSYEGLHFLGRRHPETKYLTIFKNDKEVWSGNPKFVSTYLVESLNAKHKMRKYLISHTYETGHTRTQLQFHKVWFHHLPSEGDLDIWKEILIDDGKAYTAEVEFKD